VNLDWKDPEEIIVVTFPFADELGTETIGVGTPVVTVSVKEGADANAAQMLNGAPVISGTSVLQSVRNGVNAVLYGLRCRIDTSGGRRLVLTANLPVRTA